MYLAPSASSSCLRTFRIRRQKAPFMRKNLSQSELNEPLTLLVYLASAARISGRFAPSFEAKSASESGAPSPCDSEALPLLVINDL